VYFWPKLSMYSTGKNVSITAASLSSAAYASPTVKIHPRKSAYSSLHRSVTFSLCILLLFTSVACEQRVEVLSDETNIPINLPSLHLQADVLPDVINQAIKRIQHKLPQAVFTGLVIFGDCGALPDIDGKITLIFMQSEYGLLGRRSHMATASVSTTKQEMDIRIVTDPYLNYVPQAYNEVELNTVLQSITAYIQEQNFTQCTVELAKIQNLWDVTCSQMEAKEWKRICHVTVEAASGSIREVSE